ncbi:MAG: PLD nuclease N-terminal domain-containing protein [Propionibacteriaceae bacterium]|nr:PLD nuclease N-terminal domain-containing protein [Propionibacteriaceae bacterium]
MTDQLRSYLPIIIPLAIIEVGLMVAALIHIFSHKKYRFGNRWVWVVISVLFNLIGPILYFAVGRGETQDDE